VWINSEAQLSKKERKERWGVSGLSHGGGAAMAMANFETERGGGGGTTMANASNDVRAY